VEEKSVYDELFALLNSAKVKYLVVGAYAVSYYAEPRHTGDIDIFVSTEPANAALLFKVLGDFGFGGIGIKENDLKAPDTILQLGYPPLRIDIITGISGVRFPDAWKSRKRGRLGQSTVWYISKADLIKNKRKSGRPKDKIDLLMLRNKP
jgi:hypothetical protein